MISGLLCISEKFRLASSSCPNPSFPNVSVFSLMFRFFRISPSFIFHFRFISGIFRRSCFINSGILCICEIFRLVSISLRHSYLIISVSISDYSVVIFSEVSVLHISSFPLHFRIIPSSYFRKFPSFIFHHFRFISGFFCRHISGNFRPSYFMIPASFPDYSVVIFPEISILHIHHFRFISGLLRRLISGNFRHSYFIISASFPDHSVVLFPEVSVLHISSFPFHFRIIPSSAVRVFFDLGLFCLETETQQYVLLGIKCIYIYTYTHVLYVS